MHRTQTEWSANALERRVMFAGDAAAAVTDVVAGADDASMLAEFVMSNAEIEMRIEYYLAYLDNASTDDFLAVSVVEELRETNNTPPVQVTINNGQVSF